MGPGAAGAVLIPEAAHLAEPLQGMPFQEQGMGLGEAVGVGSAGPGGPADRPTGRR